MYLRQSNKWKEFLLTEGVEDIGLPPDIAHYLRQQNKIYGPVENSHLTWIGRLIKDLRHPNYFSARTHQTIVEDIVGRGFWPDTPEGEEAWHKAKTYFDDFYERVNGESSMAASRPNIMDMKGLKKGARRMLKKLNAHAYVIEQLDSFLDYRMLQLVKSQQANYAPIMELLKEDPAYYDELRTGEDELFYSDLSEASALARKITANPPKKKDQVIHEFDDGYFWYDLRKNACEIEGKQMKHCGGADNGTLYSLRTGAKRTDIKRYITLSMDEDKTVHQIKAKGNRAPTKELWPYIDWFLENMDVTQVREVGQHSEDGVGFAEMLGHLKNKYEGQINFGSNWNAIATGLLDQYEGAIEQDSETTLKIYYPPATTADIGPAEVQLYHHAWWPVKDVVVDENTFRIRMLIKQDAQLIANDTFYPNPHIPAPAKIYARGKQDRDAAMLEIVLMWSETFQPDDDGAESTKEEEVRLGRFLEAVAEMSRWLTSYEAAPDEDHFDYNGFLEGVQEKLEEYGVYRDIAAEQDAETERERAADRGQMDLPLRQSAGEMDLDYGLSESRIIQRWATIIK
jgi:hypothetical protein